MPPVKLAKCTTPPPPCISQIWFIIQKKMSLNFWASRCIIQFCQLREGFDKIHDLTKCFSSAQFCRWWSSGEKKTSGGGVLHVRLRINSSPPFQLCTTTVCWDRPFESLCLESAKATLWTIWHSSCASAAWLSHSSRCTRRTICNAHRWQTETNKPPLLSDICIASSDAGVQV